MSPFSLPSYTHVSDPRASFRCGNQGLHWPWLSELIGRQLAFFLIKGGEVALVTPGGPPLNEGRLCPAVAQEEASTFRTGRGLPGVWPSRCISPRPPTQPSGPWKGTLGRDCSGKGSGEAGGRMPAFPWAFSTTGGSVSKKGSWGCCWTQGQCAGMSIYKSIPKAGCPDGGHFVVGTVLGVACAAESGPQRPHNRGHKQIPTG